MCDKSIKIFAAITILLGLATLSPCLTKQCQVVSTQSSQAISEIIFHPGTQEMIVVFRDDAQYSFKDIPEETFEAFRNADSKGNHFMKHIRNKFKSTKVE